VETIYYLIMKLENVKSKLQALECPTHHQHPEVTIKGEKFEIKCCCKQFRETLVKKTTEFVGEEAKAEIEKSLRKAFKG